MDNVVPFAPRPNAGGGWTAAERERLSELADRLTANGAKVEVVYGVTDEGDPWCVIKDDQEEVLIHVARINGQFVVHDASADAIQEGETLWAACDRLLGGDWREVRDDVVVSLSARQVQTFIALVVAATFIHEVDDAEAATLPSIDHAEPAATAGPLAAVAVAAQPPSDDVQRQDLLAPQHHGPNDEAPAASAGTVAETAAEAVPQKTPAASADEAQPGPAAALETPADSAADNASASASEVHAGEVIKGGDGADTLQGGAGDDTISGGAGADSLMGGAGADHLYGGEGNDTLDGGGAPQGRFDILDGGAGDDQIHLSATTIAIGGAGADKFVITGAPSAEGLLGIVFDFSASQGDRLMYRGKDVNVVGETNTANIFEGMHNPTPDKSFVPTPGQRVEVDLDGDGQLDGYLLVGHGRTSPAGAPTDVATVDAHVTAEPGDYAVYKMQHVQDDGIFI